MSAEYSKVKAGIHGVQIGRQDAKYEKSSRFERWKTDLTKSPWKWVTLICVKVIVIAVVVTPIVVTVHRNGGRIEINADYWSSWTLFTTCSRSCGGGSRHRIRLCKGLNPSKVDVGCPGNGIEIQTCNTDPCPVNGGWGEWTSHTECSQSCGGGTHTFQRECDNSIPIDGGSTCIGKKQMTRICNTKDCPVYSNWGSWVETSGCSKTCGGGTIYRVRSCDNPAPTYDGNWCSGNASDYQPCNTQPCPGHLSAYTAVYPEDGPSSGTVKLITAVSNIGSDYNINTGQFICQHPGIYVFTLHLYKTPGVDVAHCYIRQNGSRKIRIYSDPSDNEGYYETSNTVVLELTYGDRVDLGGCSSGNDTMYYWTSFSGFLLRTIHK